MIRYSLRCAEGHEFDGWFKDSSAYDAQAAGGLIACPSCRATRVEKAVMAPSVARGERHGELRAKLAELRNTIEAAADDVGEEFPAEARKMHDGEAEPRAIRGKASLEEAKALIEDGIEILPLPGGFEEGN